MSHPWACDCKVCRIVNLTDEEAERIARRLGQAAARTLFDIVVPDATLAERARFAMSDPTPRRLCPGCLFITIRVSDECCRDCATRGGVREEVRSPRRSHAGGRSGRAAHPSP